MTMKLWIQCNQQLDLKVTVQRTLQALFIIVVGLRSTMVETNSQYIVEMIGNDIQPSAEGVDVPGIVVLLNTPFPKDGVVYAFQAYFRSLQMTAFQIWRPVSNSSSSTMFTLVGEIQVTPSTNIESIYIISQFLKCIRVRQGDRFGVFTASTPSSIGYVFNPFLSHAFTHTYENGTVPSAGETVIFKSITFPYELSCQAFYYLETLQLNISNGTFVDCPHELSVNDVGNGMSTTPVFLPINGSPGQQGPRGSPGIKGLPGPSGEQGATGFTGPVGMLGPGGGLGAPGSTGSTGSHGLSGPIGDAGDPGSPGPMVPGRIGAPGPVGPPGSTGRLIFKNTSVALAYDMSPPSDWSTKWSSELFMIGILIWLAIISTIVLILLLCLIVITCVICAIRHHDGVILTKIKQIHHQERDPYTSVRKTGSVETEFGSSVGHASGDSAEGTMRKREHTQTPTMENWMGAMKDEPVHEYNMWYGVQ